jgi:hypothetical protein
MAEATQRRILHQARVGEVSSGQLTCVEPDVVLEAVLVGDNLVAVPLPSPAPPPSRRVKFPARLRLLRRLEKLDQTDRRR